MIKLFEKSSNMAFYFHSMEDCKAFMYVFEDHFCNVPWEKPEIVPDDTKISIDHRRLLEEDPKAKAERYLSWGFNLTKKHHIGLTSAQNSYIKSAMDTTIQ